MTHRPLKVTAHLCTPFYGEPPMLDGIIEKAMMPDLPRIEVEVLGLPPIPSPFGSYRPELTRATPLPAPWRGEGLKGYEKRSGVRSQIDNFWCRRIYRWFQHREEVLPFAWGRCGDRPVPRGSCPILDRVVADSHEHLGKKLATEEALLLAPEKRVVVSTTNGWTKSHRLPMRSRLLARAGPGAGAGLGRIVWFIVGDPGAILPLLRDRVVAVAKKRSVGVGRVAHWEVEEVEADYSWFAPSEGGPVLMRRLPVGDWMPPGVAWAKRDYASVAPPYFHPENHADCLVPC